MANTIVVQITSNTRRAAEDTQLLIDQGHPDWTASGRHRPSAVHCSNIATVPGDERGWVEKPGRFREADAIANKTV